MKTEIIDQTEILYDDSKEADTVTVITSDTGPQWELWNGKPIHQFMDELWESTLNQMLQHEENNRED
jgi:hypothetical protein